MTADELNQREEELKRNQLAWKNTKADLERECLKVKAQIEALLPKLEKLQQDCEAEQTRRIELVNRQKDLQQKIAGLHAELATIAEKVVVANKELTAIDKLVADRKAGVHAEISQYKQLLQADVDEALKITQDTLKRAENDLNDTEKLLTNTQGKLEEAQNALAHTFEETDKQNVEIARLQQKEKDLKKRVEPLQAVVDGLDGQVLLKNKEVAEAEAKVEDFKNYETKAWKALRAKDKSLQGRSTELERLEQLAINRGSFLPER